MSVTERVMAAGEWSIELSPDTPGQLLEAIDIEKAAFGQLVILPTHLDPRNHTDAGMLSVARYSGIYRRQEGDFRLAGAGSAILMGDEDGKGDIFEVDRTVSDGWLSQWVTSLRPISLNAGTVYSPGGSYDGSFFLVNSRQAFEKINASFGVEWRVKPDFTLDVGSVDSLYGANPALMVTHGLNISGRDLSPLPGNMSSVAPVVGVSTVDTGWDRDFEDFTTKIVYVTENTVTTDTEVVTNQGGVWKEDVYDPDLDEWVMTNVGQNAATTDTVTEVTTETVVTSVETPDDDISFGRPSDGSAVILDRLIEASGENSSDPTSMATAQLGRFNKVRRELFVDGSRVDLGHLSPVGSWVYLYAPPVVMDTETSIQFRGQTCYPVKTRIMGMTWPVIRGYGVYLRTTQGGITWHDLTNYLAWEDGDTRLEVGALPKPTD